MSRTLLSTNNSQRRPDSTLPPLLISLCSIFKKAKPCRNSRLYLSPVCCVSRVHPQLKFSRNSRSLWRTPFPDLFMPSSRSRIVLLLIFGRQEYCYKLFMLVSYMWEPSKLFRGYSGTEFGSSHVVFARYNKRCCVENNKWRSYGSQVEKDLLYGCLTQISKVLMQNLVGLGFNGFSLFRQRGRHVCSNSFYRAVDISVFSEVFF